MKKRILALGFIIALIGTFSIVNVKLNAFSFFEAEVKPINLNGIPTIYIQPSISNDKKKLVIWLDGFTGNKERTIKYLRELSDLGYTAVSFDKYEHGERGTETPSELYKRIQSGFQRNFWTILGRSTMDTIKVIDWAIEEFSLSNSVCIGGFSMGGDIAVSVAGYDKRVNCVAAIVSSPDWIRPGRKDISRVAKTQEEQKLELEAQRYYKLLDPMTHLDAYSNQPAITFELGADDTLIQSVWALEFQKRLKDTYNDNKDSLRVVIHKNTRHEMTKKMWKNCLDWFEQHD